MPPLNPTCIDLFAGAGGMSAGFESAGFEIVAALETVPVFAKTHSRNFPQCATIVEDAQNLSPAAFAQRAGLSVRPDIIIGGPPCQTFSTIGNAKIRHVLGGCDKADPRNYLFKYYLDYVKHFMPSMFVLENVPALRTKAGGALFSRLIDIAGSYGYELHISVLNAANFGAPQNRKRLFIVGAQKGIKFNFPVETHGKSERDIFTQDDKHPVRTVREAIEDLPIIYDGCRLGNLPYSRPPQSDYQCQVRSTSGLVSNNICRVSNERAKKIFSYMRPGDKYMDLPSEIRKILPFREDIFFDRLKRLNPGEPSWTVLAHIGMDGYMYIHPWEDRTLSVREAARIQSFADNFEFVGNMREQYVQVGNAVPPLLAKAIGSSALSALT